LWGSSGRPIGFEKNTLASMIVFLRNVWLWEKQKGENCLTDKKGILEWGAAKGQGKKKVSSKGHIRAETTHCAEKQ